MSKLFIWLGVFLVGVVLGCFLKPRAIAITGALLMLVDIVGMLLVAMLADNKSSELIWMFGIAGMVIPIFFAVAWMGATVVAKFKYASVKKEKH